MTVKLSDSQKARLRVAIAAELEDKERKLGQLVRLVRDGSGKKRKLEMDLEILKLEEENKGLRSPEDAKRAPKTHFKMTADQARAELARLEAALANVQAKLDAAAAEYEQLTGHSFEGLAELAPEDPTLGVPDPAGLSPLDQALQGAEQAAKPAAPAPVDFGGGAPAAKKPAEPKPAPAPSTAPPADDFLEDKELEDKKWLNVVKQMAGNRILTGAQSKDAADEAIKKKEVDLPPELAGITMNLINYVLGFGKPQFLGPDQTYKSEAGEDGDKEILKELEKKKLFFDTYKGQIKERHKRLIEEMQKANLNQREFAFLRDELDREKETLQKLQQAQDVDQAAVAEKKHAIQLLEDQTKTINDLRENLKTDREMLAAHLARAVNSILRAPRSQESEFERVYDKTQKGWVEQRRNKSGLGEQVWNISSVSPGSIAPQGLGQLSPGISEEEAAEIAEKKLRETLIPDKPMHEQVPPAHFTGYQADAPRWSTSPGRMLAEEPEWVKPRPRPVPKSIEWQRTGPKTKPSIEYGGGVTKAPVKPKKSYFDVSSVPLTKQAADPKRFDPSDPGQMSRREKEALEGDQGAEKAAVRKFIGGLSRLEKAVLEKVKSKTPLNSAEQEALKKIKAGFAEIRAQFGYESGASRPFGAPTEAEQAQNKPVFVEIQEEQAEQRADKRETLRKQHEHGLADAQKHGPSAGMLPSPDVVALKAKKIAEINSLLAKWASDLKSIPRKDPDRSERLQELHQEWLEEYQNLRLAEPGMAVNISNWLPEALPEVFPSSSGALKQMGKALHNHARDLAASFDVKHEFIEQRQTGVPAKKTTPMKSNKTFMGKPPFAAPNKKPPADSQEGAPVETPYIHQFPADKSTQSWPEKEQLPEIAKEKGLKLPDPGKKEKEWWDDFRKKNLR